jgi:hypothetical protein
MRGGKSGSGLAPFFKAAGAALLLLLCAQGALAQQVFGYVLDIRGGWVLNRNAGAKLSKGSKLYVGSVITPSDPTDGGSYIVVVDRGGNIFERRACSNQGECARPIRLPASAGSSPSTFTRTMVAVMGILAPDPGKYASFVSRGADLQEAVLKLDAQKLDIAQVFRNMPGDRYFVRFEKIGKGQKAEPKPLEVEFDWDSQKPAPLGAGGLAPGLYKVSVREVSLLAPDEGEASGNEAWVLVATPQGYAKAAPSFDAALKMTKQWGDKVRQSSVRQFLRATLEFITTQGLP